MIYSSWSAKTGITTYYADAEETQVIARAKYCDAFQWFEIEKFDGEEFLYLRTFDKLEAAGYYVYALFLEGEILAPAIA